jgi:hypothetical protein
MQTRKKYTQPEAFAITGFADRLSRAALNHARRWRCVANVETMTALVALADTIKECVTNQVRFTVTIQYQLSLPDYETDDTFYSEDDPTGV